MFRRAFGQAAKMSTYTTDKASPFTRAVISSMRRLWVLIAFLLGEGMGLMLCLLLDIRSSWLIRVLIIPDVCIPGQLDLGVSC